MCVNQKVKYRQLISFVQRFHCSNKNKICAVKYKLCTFGDSTYALNALIFAFKPCIVQYKENDKVL